MAPLKKTGFHWWAAAREAALDFRFVQVFEPFNTKRKRESQKRTNVPPAPSEMVKYEISPLLQMKEFILPSRRKNWADPSVPSRCRADRRYTTDPGVASGPTAARYGLGNMVHCRPAWLGGVRVNLHRYHSSPAGTEKSDYLPGHNSSDRRDRQRLPTSVHRLMVKERRGKWGSATKIKQQNV